MMSSPEGGAGLKTTNKITVVSNLNFSVIYSLEIYLVMSERQNSDTNMNSEPETSLANFAHGFKVLSLRYMYICTKLGLWSTLSMRCQILLLFHAQFVWNCQREQDIGVLGFWLQYIYALCWMFLGPAIWKNRFANFEYISVSTIDLLGPGQHSENISGCDLKIRKYEVLKCSFLRWVKRSWD